MLGSNPRELGDPALWVKDSGRTRINWQKAGREPLKKLEGEKKKKLRGHAEPVDDRKQYRRAGQKKEEKDIPGGWGQPQEAVRKN